MCILLMTVSLKLTLQIQNKKKEKLSKQETNRTLIFSVRLVKVPETNSVLYIIIIIIVVVILILISNIRNAHETIGHSLGKCQQFIS